MIYFVAHAEHCLTTLAIMLDLVGSVLPLAVVMVVARMQE